MRFTTKEARQRAGLTQAELAKRSGVSQGKISEYETGTSLPRIDSAFKIANALNEKIEDLIEGAAQ